MRRKFKVMVEFVFESEKLDINTIRKSIEEQIYTDMNYYFQCDDDITNLCMVDIKEIDEVSLDYDEPPE